MLIFIYYFPLIFANFLYDRQQIITYQFSSVPDAIIEALRTPAINIDNAVAASHRVINPHVSMIHATRVTTPDRFHTGAGKGLVQWLFGRPYYRSRLWHSVSSVVCL